MSYVMQGTWTVRPCDDVPCEDEETHVYSADINHNATIVINDPGGQFDNTLVRDMQGMTDGNSITYVDGTNHSVQDWVSLWYSGEGCTDTMVLNLGEFEGDFEMKAFDMQSIDRIHLSNVVSFTALDSGGSPISPTFTANNLLGNGESGDVNGAGFGDASYDIREVDSGGVASYEIKYIDRNGEEKTILLKPEVVDGEETCVSIDYICFVRGTMIACEGGEKPVEDLAPGDKVLTKDHGYQPIRWMASRRLSAADIARNPHIRPIRIRAGALGSDMPERDLLVSPQHRMLLDDWRCEAMFGESELLIPAKALVNDHSVTVDHGAKDVEYFHFMFEQHEIVYANGVESESFHPGDFGLSTLDKAARDELFVVFPHLEQDVDAFGAPARPVLKAFEARAMMSA